MSRSSDPRFYHLNNNNSSLRVRDHVSHHAKEQVQLKTLLQKGNISRTGTNVILAPKYDDIFHCIEA
jgi:hypothetical protein